ncbi:hypothetical protein RVBP21_1280 [Pseudomonas phage BRkr]|nr:hypothetical protein RVBP21_1280 [Pseudomonas phage BRkr]
MKKLRLVKVIAKRVLWVLTFIARVQIVDPIVKAKARRAGFYSNPVDRSLEWKLADANFHADYNLARAVK